MSKLGFFKEEKEEIQDSEMTSSLSKHFSQNICDSELYLIFNFPRLLSIQIEICELIISVCQILENSQLFVLTKPKT